MGKNIEQRVTELEKMVKKLADEKGVKFRKKLGEGDTFEARGLTWTILKITEKGYMCLADRLEESKKFGSNNDWKIIEFSLYGSTTHEGERWCDRAERFPGNYTEDL